MNSLLILASLVVCQSEDSMRQIEYIRLSYRANKDMFKHINCEFKFTIGNSDNVADAQAGIFRRSITEDGTYVFDGKNARYALTAEPSDVAAVTRWRERRGTTLARTYRMLTDGKVTLYDLIHPAQDSTALFHHVEIHPDTSLFYKRFHFPLFVGDDHGRPYDVFRDLTAIVDGRAALTEFDPHARLNSLELCKISFSFDEGTCEYFIDISRGSIPIQIMAHYFKTNLDVLFKFDDIHQESKGGWLPHRMLHVIGQGTTVTQIVLTKVDAEHRPALSDFRLDFPEAIDLVDGVRHLRYPPRKTWSLLDLPGRLTPGVIPLKQMGSTLPPELPGEIEEDPQWMLYAIPGALILALIAAIWILRARKLRPRTV